MSCPRTRNLLDAWIDGELDAATAQEMSAHLAVCPACRELAGERDRLRETIRGGVPHEPVPRHVTDGVRRALARAGEEQATRRRGPTWKQAWAMAGGAMCIAAALTWSVMRFGQPAAPDGAVASHVAALAQAHGNHERLAQVASSDRHTVKPWFLGKIEFSPPVRDLSTEGFTLVGGRLDRLGDRAAAVVVYRIREHPVELYVTLDSAAGTSTPRLHATRGFNVAQWSSEGLAYAAVSDVDARDLERFARALQPGR